MPKLLKPIPETDQLVTRKVALGVIQDVLINRMGLSKDISINFPGYTEATAQPHGLISDKYEDPRLPTTDKLMIEVTEERDETFALAAATTQPEHIPMFLNTDLELEMRPQYTSMIMRISIHYRAKGKTDARRFWHLMMLKIPNREDTWLHELKYSYPMPEAYVEILKAIHVLTEKTDGYGDDFDTFFAKWVNPRYGLLSDQAGKNTLGVFSETQSRVLGFFDIGQEPDFGGKKDDTDVWEVEIPYVIRYEKPTDCYFDYPIVIHNSVMSSKYRNKTGFDRLQDHQQSRTWSLKHLESFEAASQLKRPIKDFPGRYFPTFDEFMPRMVPENTMRVFTTLTLVDADPASTDPLKLMNILDLEGEGFGFRFNDCMKAFIASEAPYITTQRNSAMNLSLYMGRHCMEGSWLEMDADMNIRSTRALNKRKYYHVRMSICTDLTYLTRDAKDRLKRNPCALENILSYITPEGMQLPPFNVVGGKVTDTSFDNIAEWLRGRSPKGGMKTVQHTQINAVYAVQR